MGNWRTVHIAGTMSGPHAALLADLLDTGPDWDRIPWEAPLAPLSFSRARPGTYGLGPWPAATVCRTGNLAWKEYEVADVARALEALVPCAPSMLLKVHCGADWECPDCVATISVGEGLVVTGRPEVAIVPAGPRGPAAWE